jgi:hypothetical protein
MLVFPTELSEKVAAAVVAAALEKMYESSSYIILFLSLEKYFSKVLSVSSILSFTFKKSR